MFKLRSKKRGHLSEEAKRKISEGNKRNWAAKKAQEKRAERQPVRDIRAVLADYLGLNPKKVSEASQDAPDSTEEEDTEICV